MATATKRTCKARNKRGEPCASPPVTADGYCASHGGLTDMREIGRRGGRSRRGISQPGPERQSLRAYLRGNFTPEEIGSVLRRAIESGDPRVERDAVKLLLAELVEPQEDRQRYDYRAEAKAASAKLMAMLERMIEQAVRDADAGRPHDPKTDSEISRMIRRAVARAREGREVELAAEIEKLLVKVAGGLLIYDPDAAQVRRVLNGLVEIGLIQPGPNWPKDEPSP